MKNEDSWRRMCVDKIECIQENNSSCRKIEKNRGQQRNKQEKHTRNDSQSAHPRLYLVFKPNTTSNSANFPWELFPIIADQKLFSFDLSSKPFFLLLSQNLDAAFSPFFFVFKPFLLLLESNAKIQSTNFA